MEKQKDRVENKKNEYRRLWGAREVQMHVLVTGSV